jgi:hypothetical protein
MIIGALMRTIQLFKERVRQHLNKPQLTYTIIWHCRRYLRTQSGAFALPECLRWVRRRPLPRPPAHTAVAMRRPVQLRARRGVVGANRIKTLARRFGLTVDQVTREFESWAMCARTAPSPAHPSAPHCRPTPVGAPAPTRRFVH